jgi:hypothetical protein
MDESRTCNAKHNPKMIYSYINSKTKAKDNIKAIKTVNGETSTNETVIAKTLNEYFNSVYTNESKQTLPTCSNKTDKDCPNTRS